MTWSAIVLCHKVIDVYLCVYIYVYFQKKRESSVTEKRGHSWTSLSVTNMVWYTLLILMGTSYSEGLTVGRTNEGFDTVPRNIDIRVISFKLDGNNLETLNSNSFDVYILLGKLSLKKCKTTYILDGTFDNQENLAHLGLAYCNIIQLPLPFGPSTTKLQLFHIFGGVNSSVILRDPYFTAFKSLTRLLIGGNNLEPFNASIMSLSLEEFRADYSKLYTFPDFRHHTKLSRITVQHNIISTIPQTHIDTLSSLTQFEASENNLLVFPSFSHMKQLYLLEVYDNNISSITCEHIEGLESLQNFRASQNLIEIMPNISYLPKLELADFSNNLIRYVPGSCLYGLPMINTLYLNNNRITQMDDNSWATGSLSLHNNMFTTPPDLYEMTSASLTLRGNPLVCNQVLCWLRMWPFNKGLPTLDDFYCSSPTAFRGMLVMKTHPTDLRCYTGKSMTYHLKVQSGINEYIYEHLYIYISYTRFYTRNIMYFLQISAL